MSCRPSSLTSRWRLIEKLDSGPARHDAPEGREGSPVLASGPRRRSCTRRSPSANAAARRGSPPVDGQRQRRPMTTRCARASSSTLECELLDRHRFRTQAEARLAIFDFIEGWYDPRRRHSGLAYLSPIHFERAHASNDRTVGSGSTIDQGGRYLGLPLGARGEVVRKQ